MNLLKSTFFILILLFSNTVYSQAIIEKAERFFENRYQTIEDGKADSKNIDQAIALFQKSNQEPEKTVGLLKSYEFKASWTRVTEDQQKGLYEKAIQLAKSKKSQYPRNGAIAYWHVANYARWADMIDITEAAQKGVIDEIKHLAERAIELDKRYNQAGALRLLGGIHLEAPNIPLILTWPSDKEAKRLLTKAYKIAPEHPANVFLYGKMLHIKDKNRKSKQVLQELIGRDARANYFLVDQKYIKKGKEYFYNNF